ncbi:MAG: DinB family protein [Chloroflexota bacterium]
MLAEVAQYLSMIEDLRGQVGELVVGAPAEALNWRPVDVAALTDDDHATNSLAVLATHVAGAEHHWIAEVIGQRPETRVRPEEFETVAESAEGLQEQLAAVEKETREILPALDEETLAGDCNARGHIVPVRWAILHVIDHTALHLGHMQLTLQLWQGGRAAGGPRWFERV